MFKSLLGHKSKPYKMNRSRLYTERRDGERLGSDICIMYHEEGELNFCRIRNVSKSGAYIETDKEFERGDKISFYITENRFGIPLEGRIMRKQRRFGMGNLRPGVGISFADQDANFPSTREDMLMYLLNYPVHKMWEWRG